MPKMVFNFYEMDPRLGNTGIDFWKTGHKLFYHLIKTEWSHVTGLGLSFIVFVLKKHAN